MSNENWQDRAIRAEHNQYFRIFLGIAPYAFAIYTSLVIPAVRDLVFPVSLIAGLGITISYLWIGQFIAVAFLGRLDSVGAIVLQWVSWGWFYYWAWWEGQLLPAFAGPILIIGTLGRLAISIGWMKDAKKGKLPGQPRL